MARKRSEERRRAIIEAGTALFAQRGYRGTTLEDIAQQAGIGKATMYYHFPGGKEAIFAAILQAEVDRVFEEILTEVGRYQRADERLSAYVRARVRTYHREVSLRGMTDEVKHEVIPVAETELRRYYQLEVELLEELIAQGAREGILRDVDPARAARVVHAMIRGLTADLSASTPAEASQREVDVLVDLLMHGLLAE